VAPATRIFVLVYQGHPRVSMNWRRSWRAWKWVSIAAWYSTNDFGEVVSRGVYVYRLQSAEFERTKKMVFLR